MQRIGIIGITLLGLSVVMWSLSGFFWA